MPTKQSGKIIFQMLTLWFFHNKPCMLINMADELQNTSQFFRHFTVPSNPLDAQVPCPGPLSRALPVLQHWHAESIPALQATSSSSIPSSHATCVTLDELTPKKQKRKHKKWRKSTARSYKEEPWLQLDRRGDKVFTWIVEGQFPNQQEKKQHWVGRHCKEAQFHF